MRILPNPAGKDSRLSFPLTWGGDKRAAAELEKDFDRALTRVSAGASIDRRTHPYYEQDEDRGRLWAVQTPQAFRRPALERALDVPAAVLARATDDAWLVERAGGRVIVVPASEENIKVTTPLDLQVAELLLRGRRPRRGAAAGGANPA